MYSRCRRASRQIQTQATIPISTYCLCTGAHETQATTQAENTGIVEAASSTARISANTVVPHHIGTAVPLLVRQKSMKARQWLGPEADNTVESLVTVYKAHAKQASCA